MKEYYLTYKNLTFKVTDGTIVLKVGDINLYAIRPKETAEFLNVLDKMIEESEELKDEV